MAEKKAKKEIYTYQAQWPLFALNWSNRPDQEMRLAIGSFCDNHENKVEIVQLKEIGNEWEIKSKATIEHPYPATKVGWIPDKLGAKPDLIATSGDYLRVWEVKETSTSTSVELKSLLSVRSLPDRRD